MKTFRLLVVSLFVAALVNAAGNDVDIRVVAKKTGGTPPKNEGDGSRTVAKEGWNYEVTIENKTFKPMTGLEVKYMIFYKTEELGSKAPAKQEHQSGTYAVEALQPHERKTFTSNSVELSKSHLTGHWYYSGGERIKAEDTLSGIWVRVYAGGTQVGEYANPSTLMKEQWQ